MPEPVALRQLCESYCDLRWHLDPVEGSDAGLSDYDDRLGVFSDEAVREYIAALRALGAAVEALSLDGLDDEIDRTALLSHIRVEEHRWLRERPHQRDPGLWAQHVLDGLYQLLLIRDRDRSRLAIAARARLEAIPGVLAAAQDTVRAAPGVLIEAALGGLGAGEALIDDVQAGFSGSGERDLGTAATLAREALGAFVAHLERLRSAADPGLSPGVGRDALTFRLQHQHAVATSTEDLLRWAGALIDETDRLLETQARALGNGSWPDVLDRLRAEHPAPDALVGHYRDAVTRCRAHVVERNLVSVPEGDLEVLETPRFARAWVPVAGYLPPGPHSSDRTGRLFVTVPGPDVNPGGHGRHAIPAAAAHEGFPGHHLQFAVAHAQDRSVRRLLSFPIGVEGWALYTEELMYETGFYRTPAERFLQLHALLWRAVRVPLDVGIHTGALDLDAGARLLQTRAKASRAHAEAEVRRACAMPGYPMSYALGRRELLALRSTYGIASAGALRDFHEAVLAYGGLPQTLVRWGMQRDA